MSILADETPTHNYPFLALVQYSVYLLNVTPLFFRESRYNIFRSEIRESGKSSLLKCLASLLLKFSFLFFRCLSNHMFFGWSVWYWSPQWIWWQGLERGKAWLRIAHSFLGTRIGKKIHHFVCIKNSTNFKLLWWPTLWSRNLIYGNGKTYDLCIRDGLFPTLRIVSPNLLPVNCSLHLWVKVKL